MTPQRCRSCGAPVLWVKTEKGKAMPLDAEPVPNGNIWLSGGVAMVGRDPAPAANPPMYVSHFATCPEAQRWRKR